MRLQVRMGRERVGESVPYGLWATYEHPAAVNTDSLAADEAALGCACCFKAALAIVAGCICPHVVAATTDYRTIIRPDVSLIGGKTREPDGRGP